MTHQNDRIAAMYTIAENPRLAIAQARELLERIAEALEALAEPE